MSTRSRRLLPVVIVLALGSGCGSDGADGSTSLVHLAAEAAGANCAAGGQRIEAGVDDDGDGMLDASEIDSVAYVCAGTAGATGNTGANSLVVTTAEAAGANCANGGQRVEVGVDDDGDALLDAAEIDSTSYVCAGANGATGARSLVAATTEAAGANCSTGGQKIESGVDDDDDGILDAAEVDSTIYVCNGATGPAGLSSLIEVTPEPAGANCAEGGQRIVVGLDDNANGTLEIAEQDATRYVCNGATGGAGADGLVSLIRVVDTAADASCRTGGKQIQTGLDANANGTLDAAEVAATVVVCNYFSGLEVAIEAGAGADVRLPGNSISTLVPLLLARGHAATVVSGADIDTLDELRAFDVVVLADAQSSGGDQDYYLFDPIIDDYVAAGGGLVASGWHLSTGAQAAVNLVALSPMAAGSGYLAGPLALAPVAGHPISGTLGSFVADDFVATGTGSVKAGATAILRTGATPVGAAWTVGLGRSVFLGAEYLETYDVYANESLLDGTQPNAIGFYLNSIEWAAGAR